MPFIARNFISERLIPAIAIEKLIGQFVTLKKSGSNYMGCCPFHHEKTPSFCVTPSKQMFYCFGCKEHGNAIDFLMKYKNLRTIIFERKNYVKILMQSYTKSFFTIS